MSDINTVFSYGATSDIGYGREFNEDYFDVFPLSDDCLFLAIADGMGSREMQVQPAAAAVAEVSRVIRTAFEKDPDAVKENPKLFLQLGMDAANRVMCAFKIANEDKYVGYGASMTCCIFYDSNNISFAHCGNTRLSLIRFVKDKQVIRQLTRDNTKAVKLLEEGIITPDQYPLHPDRLVLTSAIGMVADPEIQYFDGPLKENDIILLTTKGIHFAIRPEPMIDIALRSGNCEDASKSLVEAAKSVKYVDNMSAALVLIPKKK